MPSDITVGLKRVFVDQWMLLFLAAAGGAISSPFPPHFSDSVPSHRPGRGESRVWRL